MVIKTYRFVEKTLKKETYRRSKGQVLLSSNTLEHEQDASGLLARGNMPMDLWVQITRDFFQIIEGFG